MHRIEETSTLIKQLNKYKLGEIKPYIFVKEVCNFFDLIKNDPLNPSDFKFLQFISNVAGVPHYYDLLTSKFSNSKSYSEYSLNTFSSLLYEATLHVDSNIKIHKYQKQILDKFTPSLPNNYFLSATTSFGKTFLIYEIIKKMKYKNIVLIFPTIALLSENYERLLTDSNYTYFVDNYSIHTLSEIDEESISGKNIFIYTPERFLSFVDKEIDIDIDFVFVDEIYKIDNEYLIDNINRENERDTAYRVALYNILKYSCDVLLVGPYIEFPDTSSNTNQSFNNFLNYNNFSIINYNKYDIVDKSVTVLTSGINRIDDNLSVNLKGKKTVGDKLSSLVCEIRNINENVIIYTKGSGTAESKAKSIISTSNKRKSRSKSLSGFIKHLKNNYKFKDWTVIKALEHKIGIHHGLVPKYIQKEIINLFNNGDIDILISTTTITEGVNTSAKNLIVLNTLKGTKPLKTFDAKNIAGRAGRFLHHFKGRVLMFDNKFNDILNGNDNEIRHKNFDPNSIKDEIDFFITNGIFLNIDDKKRKREIVKKQKYRDIPDYIIQMYKVIPYSDKIYIHDKIIELDYYKVTLINNFIKKLSYLSLDFDGFSVILNIIKPVVKNEKLNFLIETKRPIKKGKNYGKSYSILVYMLSSYLEEGFIGSVKYNLTRDIKLTKGYRKFTTDEAIRESSTFIYNTLKYQLVKYLGIFNVMYKYIISKEKSIEFDKVKGIDKLLVKLEYNAFTSKGRLASDYGVPHKIIDYYDNEDTNKNLLDQFDKFELDKLNIIEDILSKK